MRREKGTRKGYRKKIQGSINALLDGRGPEGGIPRVFSGFRGYKTGILDLFAGLPDLRPRQQRHIAVCVAC